ncbi:MAG: hypothetical protein ACLT0Y_05515 [Christensenellales bacterium]
MEWIRKYVAEHCGKPIQEQRIGIGYSSDRSRRWVCRVFAEQGETGAN